MKQEWRKNEKNLYLPGQQPELLMVPRMKFFMIKGQGNPNGEDFSRRVEMLYSLAYTVRMMPKKGVTPDGYEEYTVYPLEGIWDLAEAGRQQKKLNKEELLYTLMIRQPDFVTPEVAALTMDMAGKKNPHPLLGDIVFDPWEDGLSVQMLHVGSYDDEPASFSRMQAFIDQHNLQRTSFSHREIYLSDPRKVEPAKLKTVLRVQVQRKD